MRLGLCLGLGRRGRGVSAPFAIAFTGLSTDSIGDYAEVGGHASIGYTTDPVSATETVKWSNSSNPADAATYGTGASPTDYAAGDGDPLYLHVTDGGETVTRSATIRYAPGTASAIADGQSFNTATAVDLDASASGTGLTWTYGATGLPAGVSINSGTGAITGTPTGATSGTVTVTATDQYSRTVQDTFTYTVVASVNPAFAGTFTQTAGSAGSPDSISGGTYSYTGADTVTLYMATTTSATPESAANIIAGSGGNIVEAATQTGFEDGTFDLTGFTDDTDPTHVQFLAAEDNNGGVSSIVVVAIADIDFTPLGFLSAEATDANTVVVTLNDTVLPTSGNTGTWAFDIDGVAATITDAAVSGSTVTLTVSDTLTSTDVLDALAYTPGNLTDERGTAMASFTGQSVTNNVPATGLTPTLLDSGDWDGTSLNDKSATVDLTGYNDTDDIYVLVSINGQNGSNDIGALTFDSTTASVLANVGTDANLTATARAFKIAGSARGSSITMSINRGGTGKLLEGSWAVYMVPGSTGETATSYSAGPTSPLTLEMDTNVGAGDAVLAVVGGTRNNATVSAVTWTGVTSDHDYGGTAGNGFFAMASAGDVAAATPRTIEALFTATEADMQRSAGIVVVVS